MDVNHQKTKTKTLKPPYANTYKSLAVDLYRPDKGIKITNPYTYQINTIILYPVIFHCLSAEVGNTTITATVKDGKIQIFILYALWYHMASKTKRQIIVMVRLSSCIREYIHRR